MIYPGKIIPTLIKAACLVMLLVNVFFVRAQEQKAALDTSKTVMLSAEQLKKYEGFFRNPDNGDMYVQFTAGENSLNAKLLWNGGRLRIFPASELEFYSKEGEKVNLKFVKQPDGNINQFSLGDNKWWVRVNDYKPPVKKEITLAPEQLKPFEGLYTLHDRNDRFIQFAVKGNSLVLKQHWDGQEVSLSAETDSSFFNKQQAMFTAKFNTKSDGRVSSVLVFKRDLWDKLDPINPSEIQLKALEGKYQFKDDKDDIIEIKSKGIDLVIKQLWDKKETVVSALTALYFNTPELSCQLRFIKDKDGSVNQVVVLADDLFERIK